MIKQDDMVWSVQVRRVDPPQFVAELLDDLGEREGELLGLEQCDSCGNVAYKLTRDGKQFYAVCTEDPDDEISHQFGGCGAAYPVRLERSQQVAY